MHHRPDSAPDSLCHRIKALEAKFHILSVRHAKAIKSLLMSDTDHNSTITLALYMHTFKGEKFSHAARFWGRSRPPHHFSKAAGRTPNRAAHHLCQAFLLFFSPELWFHCLAPAFSVWPGAKSSKALCEMGADLSHSHYINSPNTHSCLSTCAPSPIHLVISAHLMQRALVSQ